MYDRPDYPFTCLIAHTHLQAVLKSIAAANSLREQSQMPQVAISEPLSHGPAGDTCHWLQVSIPSMVVDAIESLNAENPDHVRSLFQLRVSELQLTMAAEDNLHDVR